MAASSRHISEQISIDSQGEVIFKDGHFPTEPAELVPYAMYLACGILAKKVICPTKNNRILLAYNEQIMVYVWTALMVLGEKLPNMKFGHEAISIVFASTFRPKDQIGFLFSRYASSSLYETVFKFYLEPNMYDIKKYPAEYKAEIARQIEVKKQKQQALFDAVSKGDHAAIDACIHHGASVLAHNSDGHNCILIAAKAGHNHTIDYLINRYGLDVRNKSGKGSNAVLIAASAGHTSTVNYLVNHHKLDVDQQNNDGNSALHMAAVGGHHEVIDLLMRLGKLHIDIKNKAGRTPLLSASWAGLIATVDYLVQRGANTTIKCNAGFTALHQAASGGYTALVSHLLKHYQLDVDAQAHSSSTAEMIAQQQGHHETAAYLAKIAKEKKRQALSTYSQALEAQYLQQPAADIAGSNSSVHGPERVPSLAIPLPISPSGLAQSSTSTVQPSLTKVEFGEIYKVYAHHLVSASQALAIPTRAQTLDFSSANFGLKGAEIAIHVLRSIPFHIKNVILVHSNLDRINSRDLLRLINALPSHLAMLDFSENNLHKWQRPFKFLQTKPKNIDVKRDFVYLYPEPTDLYPRVCITYRDDRGDIHAQNLNLESLNDPLRRRLSQARPSFSEDELEALFQASQISSISRDKTDVANILSAFPRNLKILNLKIPSKYSGFSIEGMQCLDKLTVVSLSGSYIYISTMRFSQNLRELYLSDCQLDRFSIEVIVKFFKTLPLALDILDISKNNLNKHGTQFLIEAFSAIGSNIKRVNISNNGFEKMPFEQFIEIVAAFPLEVMSIEADAELVIPTMHERVKIRRALEEKRKAEALVLLNKELHQLVVKSDAKIADIKKLLDMGAGINYQNEVGYSTLMLALDAQNERVAEYLLNQGASPDLIATDGTKASDLIASTSTLFARLKPKEVSLSITAVTNNQQVLHTSSSTAIDRLPTIAHSDLILGRVLGAGAFGKVHHGQWVHEEVAIKVLHNANSMAPEEVTHFFQEAEVMAGLKSAYVVQLRGVTQEPYQLVMEYLPKGSLFRLLHNSTEVLDWGMRLQLSADIARALAFLHHHGILHRDLKSENILLTHDYRAKLADFGLSKVRASVSHTTRQGMVGTLAWMAPEILDDDNKNPYQPCSDVYSYAVIVWEIATRKVPHEGASAANILMRMLIKQYREPIPSDTPEVLRQTIVDCWEQEGSQRPTMTNVVERLAATAITSSAPQHACSSTDVDISIVTTVGLSASSARHDSIGFAGNMGSIGVGMFPSSSSIGPSRYDRDVGEAQGKILRQDDKRFVSNQGSVGFGTSP